MSTVVPLGPSSALFGLARGSAWLSVSRVLVRLKAFKKAKERKDAEDAETTRTLEAARAVEIQALKQGAIAAAAAKKAAELAEAATSKASLDNWSDEPIATPGELSLQFLYSPDSALDRTPRV